MKVGYLNANFPLGSTNVGPLVLAMKQAGVNGLTTGILTSSTFAIVDGLKQEGVALRAAVPPTGYGGDLIQGGSDARMEAQGLYFSLAWEPVEMDTSATQKLQSALATYAGVHGDPTFAEYLGYLTVAAFESALKGAGSNPTQGSLINAALGITNFDSLGLTAGHTIGFEMSSRGNAYGADNCLWFTRYEGNAFQLVQGADPICGTIIQGVKVSASS